MMIKLHTQQGDCILEIVSMIPPRAKRIKIGKTFTVLKGEGVNVHEITNTEGLEGYELDGVLYLKADTKKEIKHSEHSKDRRTELLPNKIYRRRIEREFSYEDMEARNTRD
jgi:hypothetical protein